jgi:hypothetical protein
MNDSMINELAEMIPDFPGPANQMRCFAHILNLIAKTIIKQFDIPKRTGKLDDEDELLKELAEGVEMEEIETRIANTGEEGDPDNEEGWVDETELLSEEEQSQLDVDVLPIRLVIVKVRMCFVSVENADQSS